MITRLACVLCVILLPFITNAKAYDDCYVIDQDTKDRIAMLNGTIADAKETQKKYTRTHNGWYWTTRVIYGGGGIYSIVAAAASHAMTAGISGVVAAVGALLTDIQKEEDPNWIAASTACGDVVIKEVLVTKLSSYCYSDASTFNIELNEAVESISSSKESCLRAANHAKLGGI